MLALAVVTTPLVPSATASRIMVPVARVSLPPAIDWQAEYQGQILCSPWSKPGAVKLMKLLRRTYGSYTTYIPRSCDTPGVSEHEEGRALDWMVDSEDSVARAKARAFLRWLVAPGPNGEPGANARRLGIMYLIYEDKMWRVYRPEDGWSEYNGCFSTQSEGYDTTCHRDHIHISLTWDGAYARTSFWTGRAEVRTPCDSSFATRPNGSRAAPRSLINTDSGIGVPGKHCRLSAGTEYSSRSYRVQVPVPDLPSGVRPIQHVRIERFMLNSPTGMTIRSAKTQTIPQDTRPGTVIDVPLARDGVIDVDLGAGYAQVWLRGIGVDGTPTPAQPPTPPASSKPARVTLPAFAAKSRVNTPVTVAGVLKRVPAGSTLSIRRQYGGERPVTVARTTVGSGRYRVVTPGLRRSGRFRFQAVVTAAGRTIDTSATRGILIAPAQLTLAPPAPERRVGRKVRLAGTVTGAPRHASVVVLVKVRARKWAIVQSRPFGNGAYKTRKRVATSGRHLFRTALVSPGALWAASPIYRVRVRK